MHPDWVTDVVNELVSAAAVGGRGPRRPRRRVRHARRRLRVAHRHERRRCVRLDGDGIESDADGARFEFTGTGVTRDGLGVDAFGESRTGVKASECSLPVDEAMGSRVCRSKK
jgi:hypothetical protein